jgi:ELWxxDGT repeat protein/autotransporter-associated beta strand protein
MMVRDINANSASSSISNMTPAGGILYFTATDGIHGQELWRSDGTESGTHMVIDLNPLSADSSPSNLFFHDGWLYFHARHSNSGTWGVWRTDGTETGTHLITSDSGSPLSRNDQANFVVYKDFVYTCASSTLWRINPASGVATDTGITNASSGLAATASGIYFVRSGVKSGFFTWELCTTDGTAAGTATKSWWWQNWNQSPTKLTAVGDQVFFEVVNYANQTNTKSVWRTQGNDTAVLQTPSSLAGAVADGTTLYFVGGSPYSNVYKASPGTTSSRVLYTYGFIANLGLTSTGLYFTGNVGLAPFMNFELWRHDLTSSTTTSIELDPSQSTGGYPESFVEYGGKTFFSADNGTNGRRLWVTNGLPSGTAMVSGTTAASPTDLTVTTAGVFFIATDGSNGQELWLYRDNRAPTDIAISATSITENAGVNGAIGSLSTVDPDAGDTFTYTLVTGAGSTDNAAFNISGNQLRANGSFDYEARNSYSIRIRSTDRGGLSMEKTFTISVTNSNDPPSALVLSRLSVNVPESVRPTIPLPLATVSVIDDGMGLNTLSLSGDDASFFSVADGQLWLRPGVDFDYGVKNRYSVVVTGRDATLTGSSPVSTMFTLIIENEPAYHGREYIETASGETVTDTDTRSGATHLIKRGGGKVVMTGSNAHTGGTTVEGGEVVIRNSAALGSGRLTVKSGATVTLDVQDGTVGIGSLSVEPGARLDVGYGKFTIPAGGYAISPIRQLLLGGFVNAWAGAAGFVSQSAAAINGGSVGYVVNDDGSITVGFAADGDTNLDGFIDILDVSNVSGSGKFDTGIASGWSDGDFNYDGIVDILDAMSLMTTGLVDAGPYMTTAAPATPAPIAAATPSTLSAIEAAFLSLAADTGSEGTSPTVKKPRFSKA